MVCKFCGCEGVENFCMRCGKHRISGEKVIGSTDGKLCLQCGTTAQGKRAMRGSFAIEVLLWLCFILPGLIYSLWRLSTVYYVCPRCGSDRRIPVDSPLAQRAAGRFVAVFFVLALLRTACFAQWGEVTPSWKIMPHTHNWKTNDWTLPEGTPVRLRLTETISSKTAREGDTADLETVDTIAVNGIAIVPRSSKVRLTVTMVKAKKRLGRGGKLALAVGAIELANGDKLVLRGIPDSATGEGKTREEVAGSIVGAAGYPLIAPLLLRHGEDAVLFEDTEIEAYTDAAYKVDPARFRK